jgi:uncharacterized protein (TIGR00725 family)
MSAIAVFGSSKSKPGQYEYDTARLIGSILAQNGIDIITGGYEGVMEAALLGASEYSVNRIGITFKNSLGLLKNQFVKLEIQAENYIDRLMKQLETADGYIILPGGTGSMLEFAAIWALKERMIINDKPAVTLGELWYELMQTICFYSGSKIDNIKSIYNAENAQDAVDFILAKLNLNK